MTAFGMTTVVSGSMEAVRAKVQEALKAQGFGVLTEINVQQTLKEKIGAEIEPYLILGACNPQFAYQAITIDPNIGLFLPCNVILRGKDGQVAVTIIDPVAMFAMLDEETRAKLGKLAEDARQRLSAVIEQLNAG
jgi:uncharacterized protein (DUF302 family)